MGAATLCDVVAGRVCASRIVAVIVGDLWCDELYRRAAHPRDWPTYGTGSAGRRRVEVSNQTGNETGPDCNPDRNRSRNGIGYAASWSVVWRQTDRSIDFHIYSTAACARRLACLLASCTPGDESGSNDSFAMRID